VDLRQRGEEEGVRGGEGGDRGETIGGERGVGGRGGRELEGAGLRRRGWG